MSALEFGSGNAVSSAADRDDQPADAALDAAWDAYRRWDAAAIVRKRRLDWSRVVIFVLLVAAALSGVLAVIAT